MLKRLNSLTEAKHLKIPINTKKNTILTKFSSFQASCIDSTAQPEAVFAAEVKKLQADKLKPQEQLTLEPYERDHAVVVGIFRAPPKKA